MLDRIDRVVRRRVFSLIVPPKLVGGVLDAPLDEFVIRERLGELELGEDVLERLHPDVVVEQGPPAGTLRPAHQRVARISPAERVAGQYDRVADGQAAHNSGDTP